MGWKMMAQFFAFIINCWMVEVPSRLFKRSEQSHTDTWAKYHTSVGQKCLWVTRGQLCWGWRSWTPDLQILEDSVLHVGTVITWPNGFLCVWSQLVGRQKWLI
jgi:hypothetical protein